MALQEIVCLLSEDKCYQLRKVETLLSKELKRHREEGNVQKWTILCKNIERKLREKVKIPRVRINFIILQLRVMRNWLEGRPHPPNGNRYKWLYTCTMFKLIPIQIYPRTFVDVS